MFNTDSINFVDFSFLEGQVDLILEALELYAFNLHNVWAVDTDSDIEDLRNALIFHTYEQISSKYSSCRMKYDVMKSCRLHRKRKRNIEFIKARNSA